MYQNLLAQKVYCSDGGKEETGVQHAQEHDVQREPLELRLCGGGMVPTSRERVGECLPG